MPVDKWGNRAQIIMDVSSTPSRLNVGRLYEIYIKAGMKKVEELVHTKLKDYNFKDVRNIPNKLVKELFNLPLGFVKILDNEMVTPYQNAYDSNDYELMRDVLINITEDAFRIYLTLDNEKRKYMIVEELNSSMYKPNKDVVSFRYNDRDVVSKDKILIGPMYIILLNKIADTILTTSSASVNYHGLPVVVSKTDKNNLPFKNNPVRALGETEGRIFTAYGGRELLAELKDMNASLTSHKIVYSEILRAKIPTNIPKLIDRKKVKFGKDRGLEILDTLYSSVGIEIKHVKDKNRLVEVKDNVEVDTIHVDSITDIENM